MSRSVGSPTSSLTYFAKSILSTSSWLPISAGSSTPRSFAIALDELVALGVHRARVERVLGAADPQEARGLLERLGPEAGDVQELRRARERAVRVAVHDDLLRERLADAGDVAEQLRARGVELDADVVDAALDDIAELLAEQRLVDVVLVLADADRLRLDLHELGERILQAPRDRDRAAHREVELGELLAREVARRVHARAGLVDLHDERRDTRAGRTPAGEPGAGSRGSP